MERQYCSGNGGGDDLGNLDFDRPAPPSGPKRLQRISRSGHNQHHHTNAPVSAMPTYSKQQSHQRSSTVGRQQFLQRKSYQRPPSQPRHQPQPQPQQASNYRHFQPPSNQSVRPQYSPAYSDHVAAVNRQPSFVPPYQRASSGGSSPRYSSQQTTSGAASQGTTAPYPSAMVVGGGMPSTSRIVPTTALMNAVASSDINRYQREQDFTNVLGRRRPTNDSVSSNGSGSGINEPSYSRPYQQPISSAPEQPMPSVPEQPFNGNAAREYGMMNAGQHRRYHRPATAHGSNPHTTLSTAPITTAAEVGRINRSGSNASSSSGGYRGNYATSSYATQGRKPSQYHYQTSAAAAATAVTAAQQGLRKQSSSASIHISGNGRPTTPALAGRNSADGSPGIYRPHQASRSVPDLNMDAMRKAINDVAYNLDQNPVPPIPPPLTTTSSNASGYHPNQTAVATMPPLSVNTNVAMREGARVPATGDTLQTAASRLLSDNATTASIVSAATASPSRPPTVPVNTKLVSLLENVKPVYPAMLSLVAESFYEILSQVLQTKTRNGLEYTECFTGRDAVDTVAAIIKATDRNLAIVVGRALEQQKLFHDVGYERRLRDDATELYAFDNEVVSAVLRTDGGSAINDDTVSTMASGEYEDGIDAVSPTTATTTTTTTPRPIAGAAPINGVFVMLTDCYSPTCSASQPCYSVTCPRQRSQQDHLRKTAKSNVAAEMKQEKIWSMSVPKEIVKSVSRKELDRQERLFEVFYGEKDYVRDLCILRDLYMKPLHNGDIVAESRRKDFITKVFKNALAVLAENIVLQRALERRQKESFVCYQIGDVFLPFVDSLEAYLEYCANQPYSLYFLEAEKRNNHRLVEFLEKTDRKPECRKLGVQHFITRPPTRLARYPLVLKEALKYTPNGHPDRETIPHVISRIQAMLERINAETGKAQNRIRLYKVDEKLVCSATDRNNLRLTDEQRKLIRDSQLRKRGSADTSSIQVLLLDHMLLMCKIKRDPRTGDEKYIVYKAPIPLQLLTICNPDDPSSMRPRMAARRDSINGVTPLSMAAPGGSALSPSETISSTGGKSKSNPTTAAADGKPTIIAIDTSDSQKDKYMYPLQITYLGRRGFTVTLYANKQADRQQWYQCIEQQQIELMERRRKFEMVSVACPFPPGVRVNTADVYDHGRGVIIGTDRGLYMGVSGKPSSFQLLGHLRHDRVHQIEIHEGLNVMAMIADKDRNLYVYPLDLLMTSNTNHNSRHGVRIKPLHTHVSFFRFGQFQDVDILCSVRSTTLSNQTIIHVYKPIVNQQRGRSLGRRFLSLGGDSGADSWKCIKECYIAAESTSLHFLRSRLCVGCSRGFEIVDLATMNTQSLLDPADKSLGFVNKRENSHPIALFRVHDGQFLLCYDEFAFYVNRNGQRARSNWIIRWVGTPSAFKFEYPYVLAFDSQFIEVYHVETAAIVQVIITGNCASLSPTSSPVNLCVTSPSASQSQDILRIQPLMVKDSQI